MDTVGRFEWVLFPDLENLLCKAKVDTGAYYCTMHATDIKMFRREGKRFVRFQSAHRGIQIHSEAWLVGEVLKKKRIKNSFGHIERRYLIRAFVTIGGNPYSTTVTLTDRSNLKFPMLIGRALIKKKFMVDVSRKYVQGIPEPNQQ